MVRHAALHRREPRSGWCRSARSRSGGAESIVEVEAAVAFPPVKGRATLGHVGDRAAFDVVAGTLGVAVRPGARRRHVAISFVRHAGAIPESGLPEPKADRRPPRGQRVPDRLITSVPVPR